MMYFETLTDINMRFAEVFAWLRLKGKTRCRPICATLGGYVL